jgi:hypothetical protein
MHLRITRVTGRLQETGRVFMVSLNKRRYPKTSLGLQPGVCLLDKTFAMPRRLKSG